jgi:hypothetical protein
MVSDASELEAVMRYHERSKHHFNRYAVGPGELDWANQPDPFRRYAGAVLTRSPVLGADEEPVSPAYESLCARGADLHVRGAVTGAPVKLRTLSRLLEYALALSAWKQAGGTRWAMRVNPSSGNLHPTEGYVLIGGIDAGHPVRCLPRSWSHGRGQAGRTYRTPGSADFHGPPTARHAGC